MTGPFSGREQAKNRFHALDFRVMKHSFEIHNRMGNCHDEEVYRNELLHLIQKEGIQAQMEVPLAVQFRSFKKTYFLDLLLEAAYIYELKAITNLTNQCRSQLINYQLIAEQPHGKLINFGGRSVESEFSTCTLTRNERQSFSINKQEWVESNDSNHGFFALTSALISEWGTRLDPNLYSEALLALLPEGKESRIHIISDDRIIGTKLVRLAGPEIAFKITTSKKPNPLKLQFQKFVNHTNLLALFWINLDRNQVSFHTLKKK